MAGERIASRACRRASAGSAWASGTWPAWPSTRWCKSGELKAPIVIGRDHLDSGSVASPNRETEAMQDGSDAVSDWPLLNALLNTASGATWVSLHHGGGVGMGYSQHAGVVIVCDGTHGGRREDRARAVERSGHRRDAPCGRGLRDRRRVRARARPEPADAGMSVPDTEIIVPGELTLAAAAPPVRQPERVHGAARPGLPRRHPRQRRTGARAPPKATRRSTASTPASASWPRSASRATTWRCCS